MKTAIRFFVHHSHQMLHALFVVTKQQQDTNSGMAQIEVLLQRKVLHISLHQMIE